MQARETRYFCRPSFPSPSPPLPGLSTRTRGERAALGFGAGLPRCPGTATPPWQVVRGGDGHCLRLLLWSPASTFVFNRDDVLLRGDTTILHALEALCLLYDVCMGEPTYPLRSSHGECVTEAARAAARSDRLGGRVDPRQVISSRSPLVATAAGLARRLPGRPMSPTLATSVGHSMSPARSWQPLHPPPP